MFVDESEVDSAGILKIENVSIEWEFSEEIIKAELNENVIRWID